MAKEGEEGGENSLPGFGTPLTLSENMAPEKNNKAGKLNSLCTADSQLPGSGEKQSTSLTPRYLPKRRREQGDQGRDSGPSPRQAAAGRSWERKSLNGFCSSGVAGGANP